MEHKMTPAWRPVCPEVNRALGNIPKGAFNFGLYFQKWFYVAKGSLSADRWKRTDAWKCSQEDKTTLFKSADFCRRNELLDNMPVSIALFNGDREYRGKKPIRRGEDNQGRPKYNEEPTQIQVEGSWDRQHFAALLAAKHRALEQVAAAFEKVGCLYYKQEGILVSPLVVGLGNEHPTEKGFRFDWTLGIPAIPASSIKGVVRLAWLVNALRNWKGLDQEQCRKLLKEREERGFLECSERSLFGCGGEGKAFRGRVVFFDAYPATLPKLKAEIMNCHYPDYLKKERGPTEDQSPNPQKFWALDPFAENQAPLRFIFRFLVQKDLASDPDVRGAFETAVREALQQHGLGAKTAIGHGRFTGKALPHDRTRTEDQPRDAETLEADGAGEQVRPKVDPVPPPKAATEVWKKAVLDWNQGSSTLTAEVQGKKARARGLELVTDDALRERLTGKKKKVVYGWVRVAVQTEIYFTILEVRKIG